MFGKVNPAPAVSRCVRMVFRNLLAPIKQSKTIQNDPKTLYQLKIWVFSFFLLHMAIGKELVGRK